MGGVHPEGCRVTVSGGLVAPAGLLFAGTEEGAGVPIQHLFFIIHCGAGNQYTNTLQPAMGTPAPHVPVPTHLVSEPRPSASEPLRPPSSSRAPPRRLSVVNMPLTSRYRQSAITLDCCRKWSGVQTRAGAGNGKTKASRVGCLHDAAEACAVPGGGGGRHMNHS